MTSSNMITLTPQMKKQLTLHGSLSLPLRIGERAWITHGDFSIVTSPVKKIWEVGVERIIFETHNTIYTLQFSIVSSATEVMCA